jgi:glyoxylase-like metal-dependent hydrolase (beta-lactamase superfamily II)
MEVAPGIHRIDTPLGERVNSVYLFVGDDLLLFDTAIDGASETHVLPYLASIGREPAEVRWVVVSHCDVDHFGGLASALAAFPAAVACAHHLDADEIEDFAVYERRRVRGFRDEHDLDESPEGLAWVRSVGRAGPLRQRLGGGESIVLGRDWTVDVLHVPGHSHGHLAIWDPRSQAAVVSDAVLSDAVRTASGDAAFPPTYRYVAAYRATIGALLGRRPASLLTAHYPTMRGDDVAAFLHSSAGFAATIESAVRRALIGRRRALVDLLPDVNADVASWPTIGTEGALAFPVVGHLEDLWARGAVRRLEGRPTTWELT